jgi:hypothetical protein
MSGHRPSRLLTVVAGHATGDFAVTADSTFAELAPLLAGALGAQVEGGPSTGWELRREGPTPTALHPSHTPETVGLLDGDVVWLQAGPDA